MSRIQRRVVDNVFIQRLRTFFTNVTFVNLRCESQGKSPREKENAPGEMFYTHQTDLPLGRP